MNNPLKNKHLILTLPLFLAASLFLPTYVVPFAHASPGTGLVCITSSTSATSCPGSAPTIGPLTFGSTFSVGVFVQGSDAMGGFDIYVASNPAYVSPVSAALGTLIASPSLTSICVNGSSQTGACTTNSANGPGVVEVTTIESSGGNECGGISPCSGMAFTITYQVVGTTPSTPLTYPTHPACSQSSVSSPPNVCVQVADAFGTTLSENIQGATVTIAVPPATVCITASSTALQCPVANPVLIGPITAGQTFTVGVFVQTSQPLGGFDIYVQVDPQYLNPIDVQLGTLIASPSLTTRCINGQSLEGTCTPPPPNGQGTVEVSTVESSGANDCPTTAQAGPCSGMAFTITYQKVGTTPSTDITYPFSPNCSTSSASPNQCVLVADNTGTPLTENTQTATVTEPGFVDPVVSTIICAAPSPHPVWQPMTCTVTLTDNGTHNVPPVKTVTWTTDGSGVYQPTNTCTLQPKGPSQPKSSNCNITYLPIGAGNGVHNVGILYNGDTVHSGLVNQTAQNIAKATPIVSTQIVVDQTGQPLSGSLPYGYTYHDTVVMNGGAPPQGVSGTVTYSLYTNTACTGTATVISTVNVGASNDVPPSTSVKPAAGSYGINARFNGDGNNNAVTSPCEPLTIGQAPTFTGGKVSWTHHLSLSKNSNTQTYTAKVANPLSTSVSVVVRITGASTSNPSMNFDVTCGSICVNTGDYATVSQAAAAAGPVSVVAGASSFSFSFGQTISGAFLGQKVSFTATLYWSTGTVYLSSDTKTGAFAVVA